eukprot:XP_001698446.1 predicted protein [Chlamydomonas reinhardtii]
MHRQRSGLAVMLALTTALALVGPPAAAAASGPSKPNPSTPGPLNARASDPMEPELAGLRRQLAETQAALDSIATRVGLMSPQAAATGPASGQPRSGPAPYTRTQLLSTLLPEAEAHYSPQAGLGNLEAWDVLVKMLAAIPGVWGAGEDTAMAPLTTAVNQLLATQGLSQPDKLAEYGRRTVDKMLRNLWLIGYIQLLLPGSCLVAVARHPLDAGLSCYSQPFGYSGVPWAWSLEHIGEQIRMTAALLAHWRQHLPPGRLLTLYYEELVAAPEATARRLLAHCGLPWDPAVLAFHTSNRTVATASVVQVRQPLYTKAVGRWRKYERQLAPLAAAVAAEVLWQAVSEAVQVPDQVPDCEWEAGLVSVSVSTGVAPTGWCSGRP